MEFTELHLIVIILIALWLYFISIYSDNKEKMFAYLQFGFCLPLTIEMASLLFRNNIFFGSFILFLIPITSLIIIVDSFFYSKKMNKNKK